MTTALEGNTLLIDEYLPHYHFTRIENLVVPGKPADVYEVVRRLDLLTVHSPITDLAMFVRVLPERLKRWRRSQSEPPAPPPATLKISSMFDRAGYEHTETLDGWVGLAEERGRELTFGAVGKPWLANIEWRTLPSFEFTGFHEPGWAKIAASVVVREHGSHRTLITYEARTALTDQRSGERFERYWTLVSPFVGTIMRAMLDTVADQLEPPLGTAGD